MHTFQSKQERSSQRAASGNGKPGSLAHSISQQKHPVPDLQRAAESYTVLGPSQAGVESKDAALVGGPGRLSFNFANIPVFSPPVRGIQRKLTVNAPGDAYEQEADRVAEQVMRRPDPGAATPAVSGGVAGVQRACACGGSCDDCKKKTTEHAEVQMKAAGPGMAGGIEAPPIVHDVLRSSGQSLDAGTRAFMEPRFGHDFSKVRIHTDAQAAESARAVQARAYTVGSNVVFGAGEYGPRTQAGQRLLGHELTHVLQQGSRTALQRQPTPAQPTPAQPTPGFSVNQVDYQKMVDQAIQGIKGNLVQTNTLAPVIEPVLQSLSSHAVWRDEKGKEKGGGAVPIPLPGTPKVVLKLKLVLDDQTTPKDAGEFQPKSKNDGTIAVMVRKVHDASDLKNVLFHEASHMIVWAIQNWGASHFTGQDRRSVRALNLSLGMHATETQGIRNQLDALATNVNKRRKQAKQTEITSKQLDETATWFLNEAEVRAETKVFELYSDTQDMLAKSGPRIFVDTSKLVGIDSAMIDLYVFDLSGKFLPTDRAGLTADDHKILDLLRDILIGIVDLQVKRQFSLTPYTMGGGITRAQVTLLPSPLTPPQFRPLPLP